MRKRKLERKLPYAKNQYVSEIMLRDGSEGPQKGWPFVIGYMRYADNFVTGTTLWKTGMK